MVGISILLAGTLGACSNSSSRLPSLGFFSLSGSTSVDPATGVTASPRVVRFGEPVPKGGGRYKVGDPYEISGRWYVPREAPSYDSVGIASWYGIDFHGRRTANGEIFDMEALTAAHPTLPMPSYAYVTNLDNRRTILVRINDRGPYAHDREIDLSRRSAAALGLETRGTGRVRVTYAGRAPLSGNDAREQEFLTAQSWYQGGGRGYASYQPTAEPQPMFDAQEAMSEPPLAWSPETYRAQHSGPRWRGR